MQKNMTVKELPDQERPYEKCLAYGAGALSDAELISVIIRTGSQGERSIDLANRIFKCGTGRTAEPFAPGRGTSDTDPWDWKCQSNSVKMYR